MDAQPDADVDGKIDRDEFAELEGDANADVDADEPAERDGLKETLCVVDPECEAVTAGEADEHADALALTLEDTLDDAEPVTDLLELTVALRAADALTELAGVCDDDIETLALVDMLRDAAVDGD